MYLKKKKKKKNQNIDKFCAIKRSCKFYKFWMRWELGIQCGDPYRQNIFSSKILDKKLSVFQIPLVSLNAYSGSRYPNVPAGRVDTWESLSVAKALDSPKSAILACMCSFNKMLEGFKSLCIIGGLQPLCRYSNPATPSENHCKLLFKKKKSIIKILMIKNHVID